MRSCGGAGEPEDGREVVLAAALDADEPHVRIGSELFLQGFA